METVEVVPGTYATTQDVMVKIVTTTTQIQTNETQVSESLVLATIVSLRSKRAEMEASIDAEIAINQALLDKVRSADRSGAVTG